MDIYPKKEFDELSYYTLEHADKNYFIHQHAVDAFTAQTADKNTKPISLTFSLLGLYLYCTKLYTGKQVQRAHMKLAENKKTLPMLPLPENRGIITVSDVLKTKPGYPRDLMIKEWCNCVWAAYLNWHTAIATLAYTELGIEY